MPVSLAAIGDDEYAPAFADYFARAKAAGGDAVAQLETQGARTAALLATVSEERAGFRYAPGKWSVRELVGHLADSERIMSYRALRIGRGDATPLAGFDQDTYIATAGFDARPLADLARELALVRAATVALFAHFDDAAFARRGTANDNPVSVRALAAIIAGHELHHLAILAERYGIGP